MGIVNTLPFSAYSDVTDSRQILNRIISNQKLWEFIRGEPRCTSSDMLSSVFEADSCRHILMQSSDRVWASTRQDWIWERPEREILVRAGGQKARANHPNPTFIDQAVTTTPFKSPATSSTIHHPTAQHFEVHPPPGRRSPVTYYTISSY